MPRNAFVISTWMQVVLNDFMSVCVCGNSKIMILGSGLGGPNYSLGSILNNLMRIGFDT